MTWIRYTRRSGPAESGCVRRKKNSSNALRATRQTVPSSMRWYIQNENATCADLGATALGCSISLDASQPELEPSDIYEEHANYEQHGSRTRIIYLGSEA